jgi:AraC-like DNA-binding protein
MDDEFRLMPGATLGGAVLSSVTIFLAMTQEARGLAWGIAIHSVLGLAFVVAALADVLRGWRADLIESRQRLSLIVLVIAGGYALVVLTVELVRLVKTPSSELELVNVLLRGAFVASMSLTVLGLSPPISEGFGCNAPAAPSPTTPAPVVTHDPDQPLIVKLQQFMTTHAGYRDASLAVAPLAARLGVSEKRLRDVINRRLGHKNFAGFVNAFRSEEVRTRLADPRHDHLPILTLALDAGFGSVVAFNRAFKDKYGVTPSEFRAGRGELVTPRQGGSG